MKTAEEILKQATVKTLNINEGSPLHNAVISAMKEYATEAVKEALEKASENLSYSYKEGFCDCGNSFGIWEINKSSILNTKIELK